MRALLLRWARFNGVGAAGVMVQLGLLTLLIRVAGLHYLAAAAIAVEAAVLHNFAWHQRWTWADRPAASVAEMARRLLRFHLLNGSVSLVGNLAIVAVLTGTFGISPIVASVAAIVACSTVNFAASNALVFRTASLAALTSALLVTHETPVRATDFAAAELKPATVAAWQQYERAVDERYDRSTQPPAPFFVHDARPEAGARTGEWQQGIKSGKVAMMRVPDPAAAVPEGRIHHWVGAIFIPGAEVDRVVKYLQDRAGQESKAFEDVTASKLLARDGNRLRVFMRLRRDNIITVNYNTEHAVEYRLLGPQRASSRSVATRIAEIEDAGTPREREKPIGNDHGFLWRLNAYWRYEKVDGGVIIECESVSLSRDVPALLRVFVNRTVEGIARESLERTLVRLRAELTRTLSSR
jgi:putative flippase GtrA